MTHGDTKAAPRGVLRAGAALLLGLLLFALAAAPAQAQVDGISYTLSPTGEYVLFENDFLGGNNGGLENGFLYGGEVGLGFGQYLTLSGVYLLNRSAQTDFSNFSIDNASDRQQAILDALDGLDARDVDLKRYGAQIKLNLGSGVGDAAEFLPYVSVGAGILEIDPDNRDVTETIYATGGVGVTFSLLDRYTLSVGGQMLAYRYNVATTFLTGDDGDLGDINDALGDDFDDVERGDFNQVNVYAPSARASLEIFLGGRRTGELTELDRAILDQFGGREGVEIFVEPFFGRIEFNDALGFPKDQNVAGVNAGFELGPFVGVRGFYWRGTSGDGVFDEVPPDNFEDIAFYGGDLNLRFGQSFGQRSFTPFGIVGAGYMNVLSGYDDDLDDDDASVPDDRYFGIAGGGVELPLGDALTLKGSARYLFMSNEDVEDLSNPDNVFGSLMYTGGLKFSFGGGGADRSPSAVLERERRREREQMREQMTERERRRSQETQQEINRLQARLDSLENQNLTQEQERREVERIRADVERAERDRDERRRFQDDDGRRATLRTGSNLSGETITLPIPEVGEVYIRVGETANDVSVETQYAPPTVIQGGQVQPGTGGMAGGLSQQQIESIVRETMRSEMAQADAEGRSINEREVERIVSETIRREIQASGGQVPSVSNEALRRELDEERQERRELEERLDRLANELEDELDEVQDRQSTPTVIQTDDEDGETQTIIGGGGGYTPERVVPTAGYAIGPGRFLVGARGDYGSDRGVGVGGLDFRFQPEAMIGFGDGVSLDLLVNGIVDVNTLQRYIGDSVSPYAGAGLGLTTETGLGVNVLLGAEYEVGGGAVFGEYSTVNFFDYNRFLIGYRAGF